jgi:hypothetical protein
MHKHLLRLLVAVALVVAAAVPASAAAESGCRDIIDGDGIYVRNELLPLVPDDSGVFSFVAHLAAPACDKITYTFELYEDDGATLLETFVVVPDGDATIDVVDHEITGYDGDKVGVVITTSKNGRIYDRAPDSGVPFVDDSGGATRTWN